MWCKCNVYHTAWQVQPSRYDNDGRVTNDVLFVIVPRRIYLYLNRTHDTQMKDNSAKDSLTFTVTEISSTPRPMAFFTMGVMRPLSVATATEISILPRSRGASPDQIAFTSGTLCKTIITIRQSNYNLKNEYLIQNHNVYHTLDSKWIIATSFY